MGDREVQRQEQAEVECVVCGETVTLVAETVAWIMGNDGRWHHEDYGAAEAVCCERLYASWWEGTFVYDLRKEAETT